MCSADLALHVWLTGNYSLINHDEVAGIIGSFITLTGSGGLLIAVLFLIFQVIDMRKEMNNMPVTNADRNVSMSGGLYLNQLSNNSGSTADGFWLYKEDEKQVYFFRYDKETNEINKIKLSIY